MKFSAFVLAGTLAASGSAVFAQQEVRIGYVTSELSPQHFQAKKFAEEVEAKLPGEFSFKLFPNGQLGTETTLVEGLQLGTLEMADVSTGGINIDPQLGFFDLPWMFRDRDHVRSALDGPLWDKVKTVVEDKGDVVMVGLYENGFRHVMSRRVIETPNDLVGLKIRLSGGKTRQEVFRALGANPTPIDWNEVFTALQTGVVDGAEAGTYGLYEAKLYQIVPNLSLTGHNYAPSFLLASESFWAALSPEQQQVFTETGLEITDWTYDKAAENEAAYLEEMRKNAEVNTVDFEAFQEKVTSVYENYIARFGDEWIKDVEAAK